MDDPPRDAWQDALEAEREAMVGRLYELVKSQHTGKELAFRASLEALADTAAVMLGAVSPSARFEAELVFLLRFHHSLVALWPGPASDGRLIDL